MFKIRSYFFFFTAFLNAPALHPCLNDDTFEGVCQAVSGASKSEFAPTYLAEMKRLHKSFNPPIDPSIQYVWVLSGRGSYLKESDDPEDDYHRMKLALGIASSLQNLPTIIYNGSPKQNDHLKQALSEGILTSHPADKFSILDLDPSDVNTRGQFKSLARDLPLSNTTVAIVTHAYHFPRVARMIESKWHPFGPNTKVVFYLVDRELKDPGVIKDMIGEIDRIPRYIEQGDLNLQFSEDFFL